MLKSFLFNISVLPSSAIQLNSQGEMHNMPTLTMSNATSTGGTILQYASQDGQFFVPGNFFKCIDIIAYIVLILF